MKYLFLFILLFVSGCRNFYESSSPPIDISYLFDHYSTFEAEDPFSMFSQSMCFYPTEDGDFKVLNNDGYYLYIWIEDIDDKKENTYDVLLDDGSVYFQIEILAFNTTDHTYIAKLKQGILSATVLIYEGCPLE